MEEAFRSGRGLFCAGALLFAVDYVVSDDDLSPPGTGIIAEIETTDGGTIPAHEGLLVLQTLIADRIGGVPTEYSRETCVGTKVMTALAQLQAGKVTRFFFPFWGGTK
jgi:hypothetical protein